MTIFEWIGSWFANTLSWWQWLILATVPPAIVALYFLKLKRKPLEVPSTYLWHKSIEDLHVNSIWQRLRRNLLLLLQLLLLLLVMLALLRPSWQAKMLTGNRFVFLVDNSASMQATDVGPSRLEEAKRRMGQRIREMDSGDVAMIVSFSDTARVVQPFTDDCGRLEDALQSIRPTQRPTSLLEALKVASGLANPGHLAEDPRDPKVAEALAAELLIFSDGKFAPVTGFSLGNLKPVFVPIGEPGATNVGITAFSVRRGEARPEEIQAFSQVRNFGRENVSVGVRLFRQGDAEPIDADRLEIPAEEARGIGFPMRDVGPGVLRLELAAGDRADSDAAVWTGDDLAWDDRAYTVVGSPRRAGVLLVTPGNEPLELALQTAAVAQIADVKIEPPEILQTKEYFRQALAGAYDLVIFDRCRPEQIPQGDSALAEAKSLMPQANTLFIGCLPPEGGWSAGAKVILPQIIPSTAHPLLQWINLGDVTLLEAAPLEEPLPQGASVLIDSDAGVMMAVAPREGFEDVVAGFPIIGEDSGQLYFGTNWLVRPSFPVFVLNVLGYLGGSRGLLGSEVVRPGQPVTLEVRWPGDEVRVHPPRGKAVILRGGKSGKFNFTSTADLGVYEVRSNGKTVRQFVVNLFDAAESDVRPKPNPALKIGYVDVPGQQGWEVGRREVWKWLLLLGLAVLLLEWYIYNRRVCL